MAGDIGIVVLFGMLPAVIAQRRARSRAGRILAAAMIALLCAFLAFELAQELGMLRLHLSVEYWNAAPAVSASKSP